jgi:hypothetical protein
MELTGAAGVASAIVAARPRMARRSLSAAMRPCSA